MPKPKIIAPYQPGDRVRALLTARDGVTCLAAVTIDCERVTTSTRRHRSLFHDPHNGRFELCQRQ
jgi:hypothetical protein